MSKLTKKITFRQVQKAVLEADDAKGTGYDVKANQFSASFSQMFKFLAKKEVDCMEARERTPEPKPLSPKSPSIEFFVDTLWKYINAEQKSRAKEARKSRKAATGKKGR